MFNLKSFSSILDLIKLFPTEQACITHLENVIWNGNVVSPFDKNSTVYKCSKNRYKCRTTNKYFNVRTGTMFENTKIPLQQWFIAIYLFTSHKKGISSHQLAKDLNVTQKTAWFMTQRIRFVIQTETYTAFSGAVEVDETFVGGKNKNRHAHKKVANSQGRSFKDKTPVVGILSRDTKKVICEVVADTKAGTIQPIILSNVEHGSTLHSDEWHGYTGLSKFYNHEVVNHNSKEYVKGNCYTNGIEGFWSLFKRGLFGIYHQVSKKHLQKYADEFTFRYNHKNDGIQDNFNLFLQMAATKRLTYETLIN